MKWDKKETTKGCSLSVCRTFLCMLLCLSMLVPFSDGGTVGAAVKKTEKAKKLPYFEVMDFSEGMACVTVWGDGGAKFGFIDKSGKEIVKPEYDKARGFVEGMACVYALKDGDYKCGFINKKGKKTVKLKYDDAADFSDGMARVEKYGEYGFVDKNGKEAVKPEYDLAGSFSEGLAAVQTNGRWGYVSKKGKKTIKQKYDDAGSFSEGLACVEKNKKWGFINKKGKEVIKPQYSYADYFSEGLALVVKNGRFGYIDKTGKRVIKMKYESAGVFSEGLARVSRNGKWGFVNKKGKEVTKIKYDSAGDFSEGLAWVVKDGEYGFINTEGKEAVKPVYDCTGNFHNGRCWVKVMEKTGDAYCEKYGYIDKTGKVVTVIGYSYTGDFSDGLACVQSGGGEYIINTSGKAVFSVAGDGDSLSGEEGHPYLSITYGRDNPDNFTGRDMVFYTYDLAAKELKEECVIPFDSQYACGVVSKAKNTVYYSGRSHPNTLGFCDGIWAYSLKTKKSRLLEKKNWSYNGIMLTDSGRLLVMAVTREHPIQPALFDLKTKTFTYMSDANREPFDLYSCGPTDLGYNYGTNEIVSIYQNEKEVYQPEFRDGEIPINTYISVASSDLVKDRKRTFSISLKIEDEVTSAAQVSENEFLVVIEHTDWDTLDTESKLYTLTFKDGKGTLKPSDLPYQNSSCWRTADGGKTFYFMVQTEENPERSLCCYDTETKELTTILSGNPEENGHIINFSILAPGS